MRKKIDDLGRVVVPAALRKKINLEKGDWIDITVENNAIMLVPVEASCVVCGVRLTEARAIPLCDTCIDTVKNER